jgi:hypothetical protein
MTAGAVLIATSMVPALAHDEIEYGSNAHERYHEDLGDAHERAHEEGFRSRAEHRVYHRALRQLHNAYHEDEDYRPYRNRYYRSWW